MVVVPDEQIVVLSEDLDVAQDMVQDQDQDPDPDPDPGALLYFPMVVAVDPDPCVFWLVDIHEDKIRLFLIEAVALSHLRSF